MTYQLVTKVLYEIRLALSKRKPLKSLAAYTLNQLKAVLPVYQVLGELVGTPAEPTPKGKAIKRSMPGYSRNLYSSKPLPISFRTRKKRSAQRNRKPRLLP